MNLFIRFSLWILNFFIKNPKNYIKLEKFVKNCNFILGIGSGGSVENSGEIQSLEKILSKMENRVIIFDIGANQGQYATSLMKNFNNKKIELHCFEPSNYTFSLLKKNIRECDSKNIFCNNFAMGEKKEDRILWSNLPGSGLASLTKRRLDHFSLDFETNERVHVETVDAYCLEKRIEHIHLLKIDIEGHELDVLNGAVAMLKKSAIDYIQFEFGGCNIDTRTFMQDFFYFLKAFDFTIHRVTPSGYCLKMPKYREEYENFVTMNFIAVSNRLMPL